jgi:hypothetical protein
MVTISGQTDRQEVSIASGGQTNRRPVLEQRLHGQTDRRSSLILRGQPDRRPISGDNECTDRQRPTGVVSIVSGQRIDEIKLTENSEHDTDVELVT